MPSKKKSVWEVYLRPNTLTKDNGRTCLGVHKLNNWSYVRPTNQTERPIRARCLIQVFLKGKLGVAVEK